MTLTKSAPAFLAIALMATGAFAAEPAKTTHVTAPKAQMAATTTPAAKKALQEKCMKSFPNDHASYLKCVDGKEIKTN